jgi:hypothetical protein
MSNSKVGRLFRSQEKWDLKKWDFFMEDAQSFFQKSGFEYLVPSSGFIHWDGRGTLWWCMWAPKDEVKTQKEGFYGAYCQYVGFGRQWKLSFLV